jgi:hypothetical protein
MVSKEALPGPWRKSQGARQTAVTKQRRYLAYLLRLWLSDNAGRPVWRGSLEDPHTGSRIGFGDVQSLLAYLSRQTELPPSASDDSEA